MPKSKLIHALIGGLLCAGVCLLANTPLLAQPLRIIVGPTPTTSLGYTLRRWAIMPVYGLYDRGPSYHEASGYRLRPGSYVPEWVETGPVENVSVTRLPAGVHQYFISPDHKIVFVGGDRRVLRVLRP